MLREAHALFDVKSAFWLARAPSSLRARAQSGVADGARARNRPVRDEQPEPCDRPKGSVAAPGSDPTSFPRPRSSRAMFGSIGCDWFGVEFHLHAHRIKYRHGQLFDLSPALNRFFRFFLFGGVEPCHLGRARLPSLSFSRCRKFPLVRCTNEPTVVLS